MEHKRFKPRPSVSVALATYNGARFIEQQLASLADQAQLPDELVVCDDQSNDATLSIINNFAKSAPFSVRVYQNDSRLHYAENFLRCVELCQGEFISFCDQDDIWLPQKIEKSIAALIETSADLCTHGSVVIDGLGRRVANKGYSVCFGVHNGLMLDPWDVFPGYSCTFRKKIFNIIHYSNRPIDLINPDRQSAHDRWIYFLASAFGTIVQIPDILALYRRHNNNTSRWSTVNAITAFGKIRDDYTHYLAKRASISNENFGLLDICVESESDWPTLSSYRAMWGALEREYTVRSQIFEVRSPFRRMRRLSQCVRQGIYTSRRGKTALRAILEDCVAVCIARARYRVSDPLPEIPCAHRQ